jgi:hypothetical protein
MVLFDISSEGSCERAACVSRHAPLWNITVSSYVRADRIILSFLSKSSQALEPFFHFSLNCVRLCAPKAGELLPPLGHISSDGGTVTPSARAYFLKIPQNMQIHIHMALLVPA